MCASCVRRCVCVVVGFYFLIAVRGKTPFLTPIAHNTHGYYLSSYTLLSFSPSLRFPFSPSPLLAVYPVPLLAVYPLPSQVQRVAIGCNGFRRRVCGARGAAVVDGSGP